MLLMLFSWGNFTEVKEVGVAAEEEKGRRPALKLVEVKGADAEKEEGVA